MRESPEDRMNRLWQKQAAIIRFKGENVIEWKPLKNWMNDMIPCKGNEDKTIKDLNKEVRERYEKYKKKFLSPNKNSDKPKLNKKNELPENYQMLEKERN